MHCAGYCWKGMNSHCRKRFRGMWMSSPWYPLPSPSSLAPAGRAKPGFAFRPSGRAGFAIKIATELRGRAKTVRLFPYSWREHLVSQDWDFSGMDTIRFSPRKPDILRLYRDYESLGGFPGIRGTENPGETLQEYYRAMFARDMIERFRIKNVPLFEDFLKLQISRFASLSSASNLEKELRELGHRGTKKTLLEYLGYAREIMVLFDAHLFSPKVGNQLLYPRKIYGIDQGLLNAIRFSMSEDRGRILENMVFLELQRRGAEVFYYSGKGITPANGRETYHWAC